MADHIHIWKPNIQIFYGKACGVFMTSNCTDQYTCVQSLLKKREKNYLKNQTILKRVLV